MKIKDDLCTTCDYCGRDIKTDEPCDYCGFTYLKAAENESHTYCPNCGSRKEGGEFASCERCGFEPKQFE